MKLIFVPLVLISVAIPLGLYLMVKTGSWNLQKLWDLAQEGNWLARIYMAIVTLAFVIAVIAQAMQIADRPSKRTSTASASSSPCFLLGVV